MDSQAERVEREKEQYNAGIDRVSYNSILSHAGYHFHQRRLRILADEFAYANGKKVLELGSATWVTWLEKNNISPLSLDCINISEAELQNGIEQAKKTRIKPNFSIMDANNLEFEDETFDMVYGAGILHHLDFCRALDEVKRVLKPGGHIVFAEPLGMNPVANLVRVFTPHARTVDEQPLRSKEIAELKERLDIKLECEQFLTVPFGVISKFTMKSPDNFLMKAAYNLDLMLLRVMPPIRFLYRSVIIVSKKTPA